MKHYADPDYTITREHFGPAGGAAQAMYAKFRSFQGLHIAAVHALVTVAGTSTAHGFDLYAGTRPIGSIELGIADVGARVDVILQAPLEPLEQLAAVSRDDATGCADLAFEFYARPDDPPLPASVEDLELDEGEQLPQYGTLDGTPGPADVPGYFRATGASVGDVLTMSEPSTDPTFYGYDENSVIVLLGITWMRWDHQADPLGENLVHVGNGYTYTVQASDVGASNSLLANVWMTVDGGDPELWASAIEGGPAYDSEPEYGAGPITA